jgi:maltose O-acetyltransferase
MTEREKMVSGELYCAADEELAGMRRRARDLVLRLNQSRDDETGLRGEIFSKLFGAVGADFFVEPPFYCDYGSNIYLGQRVFMNFNCVILDVAEVHIGDYTMFGPGVQVYTATHPLDWRVRRRELECARPIRIGADVWVGGAAVILPGVTIGDRAVIGAGALVTKDVAPGTVVAGNPARVIRSVE